MFGIFAKIKFLFFLLLLALLLLAGVLVWLSLTHPKVVELLFHTIAGGGKLDPLSLLQEQGRGLLEIARDKLPW
ncbi:hypothetical protein KJ678_04035 [Patescibacteria group bacterium]|nr:hypothetical protein [Patescibacteria group bacterium]